MSDTGKREIRMEGGREGGGGVRDGVREGKGIGAWRPTTGLTGGEPEANACEKKQKKSICLKSNSSASLNGAKHEQ